MRKGWIMSLIGGRARTPLNTPPAEVPSPENAARAAAGKIRLDHLVSTAERTVAASQQLFAAQAAKELRRF